MKRITLFILLLLSFTSVDAAIKRYMDVQYETEDGWSKKYRMEVSFMSASELNEATKTYSYGLSKYYAIIWFQDGGCAIIDMKVTIAADNILTDNTIRNIFIINSHKDGVQINDEHETKWRITAKVLGQFIDSRIK